jgi:hypothetical protein
LDEINDDRFPWPLANPVKLLNLYHFVEGNGGVHPTGDDDALRIHFLEDLGGSVGHGKRITPHIQKEYLISLEVSANLPPRGCAASRIDVCQDAVLMEDRSQETQAMILPLLVRSMRANQIPQIAQIQPEYSVLLSFGRL